MAKILIVDDEAAIRKVLREILEFEKHEVHEAKDGMEALVKVKTKGFDIVLLDIKMPKLDGNETLDRLLEIAPDTPVIMISGHGTVDSAAEAVKKGAFHFISKPPDLNRLIATINNALERNELVQEKKVLKETIKKISPSYEIIGESKAITKIKEKIKKIAPTNARVLITGQNGTGKELVARAIHDQSQRAGRNFVEVNCAAIPSELIESELFGHEKGSFTGAVKQHQGKFEQANGGTLFLDEIGDMSLSAQAKVLRALQENVISRVGSDKEIKVDVRVVAATNKNLKREIAEKKFREDLFHRLEVIPIRVPSLSERKEDIPLLVTHFAAKISLEQGTKPKKFADAALKELRQCEFTGNIRELRNLVERLIILCGDTITGKDIRNHAPKNYPGQAAVQSTVFDQFESIEDLSAFVKGAMEKSTEK